jgi:hypothetical protein
VPASGAPADAPARPEVPALVTGGRPVTDWVKPVPGRPGTFRSDGVGRSRDVELVPFYRLHRRTYAAYWDLFTPAEYEKKMAEVSAEQARQQKLEAATVGFVRPGGQEAEKAFNQQGEETSIVRADGRPGRRAAKWFSYDVPIQAAAPRALVATYNSDNRRPRSFEILVDGRKVGDERFDQSSVPRFFDVEYPLPADLVQGKQKLTVRFQATGGNEVAPVFGVRVIR